MYTHPHALSLLTKKLDGSIIYTTTKLYSSTILTRNQTYGPVASQRAKKQEKNMENEKKKDEKLTKNESGVQALKFFIFSNAAGLIQTISFTICNELLKLPYTPCYLTALTLSVLWNFTVNREFTFKSANNVPKAMFKVFLFYCVFTPLSTWWGNAMTGAGINEYLVLAFTMLINLSSEFLYYKYVVFRGSINTNARADKQRAKLAEKAAREAAEAEKEAQ